MQIGGRLPVGAPDPAVGLVRSVRALGLPVAALVPQRHLVGPGEIGYSCAGDIRAPQQITVTRSWTLLRNPDDPDDPVNLTDDERLLAELARPLTHPVPTWLVAARERARFPMIWEAVQTHWWADGEDRVDLAVVLVAHAEHVLRNRFHEVLGLEPGEWSELIPPGAVQSSPLRIDGEDVTGLLVDTDPFVLARGAELADGRLVTVVVPRDDLPMVRLELDSAAPLG